MRDAVDALLDEAVSAVERSGIITSGTRMATVSAVGSDGTITVTIAGDTIPKVRLLSGYYFPLVGDVVEITRTVGGWVCLGQLQSALPSGAVVDNRAGIVPITPTAGSPTSQTVAYPTVRGDIFVGHATANTNQAGNAVIETSVTSVTATSAIIWLYRTNSTTTSVHWSIRGVKA